MFDSRVGARSVLIGVQPEGYSRLGLEQAALGPSGGTELRHAHDCTVYAPVAGATLQVVVMARDADSGLCKVTQSVGQYVLAALVR